MERQVSNLRGAIIDKDKQISDLERSLDEHLEMLQQNTKRMTELEEGNGAVQQQVCLLSLVFQFGVLCKNEVL